MMKAVMEMMEPITDALTTDRFGNVDEAYSFDGNDYIQSSGNNLPSGERTVSTWFYIMILE